MKHTQGFFTTDDSLKLYTQSWSPDSTAKYNLIVIHGIGEHCGRYAEFAAYFVPHDFAIHTYDLRGHGKSPGQRGHIDSWRQYREDVRAFVDNVHNAAPTIPIILLGHSLGGLTVLDYGLHHTAHLCGIVSSAPALKQGEGVSAFTITMARLISPLLPRLALNTSLDVNALSRDPAIVQAYQDDPLTHGLATPRLGAEMTRTMIRTQVRADEWQADLPLLIVHGTADTICPPEGSARFFANVSARDKTRHVYTGYFHEIFNDIGREQVLADVLAWLTATFREAK